MKHLFVPYEFALLLKEKGFDESCFAHYHKDGMLSDVRLMKNSEITNKYDSCTAPLYQQVSDWLYKKSEGSCFVTYDPSDTEQTRLKLITTALKLLS